MFSNISWYNLSSKIRTSFLVFTTSFYVISYILLIFSSSILLLKSYTSFIMSLFISSSLKGQPSTCDSIRLLLLQYLWILWTIMLRITFFIVEGLNSFLTSPVLSSKRRARIAVVLIPIVLEILIVRRPLWRLRWRNYVMLLQKSRRITSSLTSLKWIAWTVVTSCLLLLLLWCWSRLF